MTILRAMAETVIAGRYRLLQPLGRGAMSSVWLAEDEELGRRVAVKMLGPNADHARFEREARAAAALSSPHICQLYDYGEAEGRPYMVLEHLGGGTLEDRLRPDRPLDDAETARIAAEVASGLAHAHGRGLVHRDLKPANILFDAEDRAKIADFGIARMGDAGTLTEAGTVLGTASYISPEQAAGRPATPASDVYSFGVMLFRMLTGRLPFVSRNAMELVRMHRDDAPPSVAEFRPDAPARLESVAAAALAKDPASRPADGAALAAELTGAAGPSTDATTVLAPGATPAATQVTGATQVVAAPGPVRRRRPVLPLVLAALAVLLLAGVALAFLMTRSSGESPAPTTPSASLDLPTLPPGKTTSKHKTTSESTTTTTPSTTASTSTTTPTTRPTTTHATTTRPVLPPPPPTTTAQPTTTTAPPTTTTAPPPTTTTTDTTTVATTLAAPSPRTNTHKGGGG
jgi:serine/threonine-protein kinase